MSVFQPRTAVIDIYQGDYLDRIRHLEQRYEDAVRVSKNEADIPQTLDEGSAAADISALAKEHRELVEEAKVSAISVTVRALGRKAWRELVMQHEARKDDPSDDALGFNADTLPDALVPLSIVEPELTQEDLDEMAEVDFDRLFWTSVSLNRSPAASPKSLGSRMSQESDEN